MNNLARWEQYTPFGVGLETFFKELDKMQDTGTSFPPYNIVTVDENTHIVEIAVAGYSQDQLEVAVEKNVLTVKATRSEDNKVYTYRGLAQRAFNRSWRLGEDVKITDVTFVNGMLNIHLCREVPEEAKRKVLPINAHIERLEAALEHHPV